MWVKAIFASGLFLSVKIPWFRAFCVYADTGFGALVIWYYVFLFYFVACLLLYADAGFLMPTFGDLAHARVQTPKCCSFF